MAPCTQLTEKMALWHMNMRLCVVTLVLQIFQLIYTIILFFFVCPLPICSHSLYYSAHDNVTIIS